MLLEESAGPSGAPEFTPAVVAGYGVMLGGLGLGITDRIVTRPNRTEIERARHVVNGLHAQWERQVREEGLLGSGFTDQERSSIARREIFLGMSESAMRESLGPPIDVNRTVTQSGESKQFIYPNGVYVYTENGVVTSWQD